MNDDEIKSMNNNIIDIKPTCNNNHELIKYKIKNKIKCNGCYIKHKNNKDQTNKISTLTNKTFKSGKLI